MLLSYIPAPVYVYTYVRNLHQYRRNSVDAYFDATLRRTLRIDANGCITVVTRTSRRSPQHGMTTDGRNRRVIDRRDAKCRKQCTVFGDGCMENAIRGHLQIAISVIDL